MSDEVVFRVRVSGRVQGVGYRAWARAEADSLGLRGWVRNDSDGTVTALVAGDPETVRAFLARLEHGPPAARVTAVETSEHASPPDTRGFVIRR